MILAAGSRGRCDARTFNPTRLIPPDVIPQRGIKLALLAAIAKAQRFIYCEDQYLVDIATAEALIAVIPRLSHVTVLIPGNDITDMERITNRGQLRRLEVCGTLASAA